MFFGTSAKVNFASAPLATAIIAPMATAVDKISFFMRSPPRFMFSLFAAVNRS